MLKMLPFFKKINLKSFKGILENNPNFHRFRREKIKENESKRNR